ncbi:MAG: class A beta-lactamase-related serine hydrolase [Bacteroidia bacterium]|nr:class A beta-lactamase-related serine hydrolase [Bacteroidia bacterium]
MTSILLALLATTSNIQAQGPLAYTGIPAFSYTANYDLPPLQNCADEQFQNELEVAIANNRTWKKLAADKKLAIGLVDLSDMSNIRFAEINGNQMMYAASLPKIAILLTAMDALESGELKDTPEVRKDMRLMISKSNNQASTRMIDRLGYEKIEEVLTSSRYKLYDKAKGGGLWVGKRYAASGKKNPDPLKGLSHAATALQISRFYYLMLQGELVCRERSQEMMECMVDPQLHHKFVNTLNKIAPDAKLFRKSGSWSTFHSDSIMVWGPDRQYILTALVNDSNGERIMRDLVYQIEKVLKG